MKSLIVIFLSLFAISISAQEFYSLNHIETNEFGYDEMPAISLNIDRVEKAMAMEEWQKVFKKYDKEEMVVDETSVILKGLVIPKITAKPYNVYSHFTPGRKGVEMIIAFRDSTSNVDIQENRNGYPLEKELVDFAEALYLKQLDMEIKSANQNLTNLEKGAKKVQKEMDKLKKDVINLQVNIDNYNKEIEMSNQAFDDVLGEINVQKGVLSATSKNDEDYKVIKKELDRLNKRKDNIDKEIKKLREKVFEAERAIEDANVSLDVLGEALLIEDEKVKVQRKAILALEEMVYGITVKM